jgi:multiple sugar transport system permease protein
MNLLKNRRAMIILAGLIVAANGFFPAIWILFTSFKTEVELMKIPITIIPQAPTIENYIRVFVDQPILRFLFNSVVVAVLSTILCVGCSALAAYALVRLRLPGAGIILSVLLAIAMFPLISMMVPLFQVMRDLGLLNTWWALIFPHVVIPLTAPGVFTAAILSFVNSWDEFLLALTLSPRVASRTLPVGITLYQGEFSFPWPIISAALIVAIVPICIVIAIFQERVVSGLTSGGMKG